MQKPVISTVVLQWNRSYLLEKTLESYIQTVTVPHELWIVDNASTDGSQEVIARFIKEHPETQAITLPENRGGEAYNAVLPELAGEFILISENDQIYLPGWCEQVLRAFHSYPKLGQLSLHAPTPTDEEAWVSKPVSPRFKNDCLLYQVHQNVTTSSVLRSELVRAGLRIHNIPGENVKFPDDLRLSTEIKQRGYWVGYSDHYYARNAGHEATEIESNPDYYRKDYAAKPAVGLKGLEQRLQLQKQLKQVQRFSTALPGENVIPQLGTAGEARFWSMFDSRTPEAECVDTIAALIRAVKPEHVLETGGWLGHLTQAIAHALTANGFGRLTTLEADAEAHAHLSHKIKALGLDNVQLEGLTGEKLITPERYDFAVMNGAYAQAVFEDQEAEFFHLANMLQDGATVVFVDYHERMPRLQNLPRKLEEMGVLRGMYIPSPHGLYIGTFRQRPNPRKRMVFCLSSGRSGTAFLSWILRGAPGLIALHEPEPRYQWQTLALQKDPAQAARFVAQVKKPWVDALPGHCYVESSHYVQKGFMEPWLAEGTRPDVIMLERAPRKIAQSRYLLGIDFFNNKELVLRDMAHPADTRPLHLPLPGWENLNNYQLCYWFALESDARSRHYLKLLTERYGAKAFVTSLEKLSDDKGDEVFKLYEWLGITLEPEDVPRLRDRQRTRVNTRSSAKKPDRQESLKTLDLDALEAQVRQRCGLT